MKRLRQLSTFVFFTLLASVSFSTSAIAENRDEVIFFFNDALGSAVAAVNESGELCWSEEYTGYGDKTINDDLVSPVGCGIVGEERGFTGHTEDVNSDLVYMQQRYYDPSIGRFLSIDPMDINPEVPTTYNRYAYANNNPYKYVDPDGEFAILAIPAYSIIKGFLIAAGVVGTAHVISNDVIQPQVDRMHNEESDSEEWEQDYEEWANDNPDDHTNHGKTRKNERNLEPKEDRATGEKFFDNETGGTVYVDGSNVSIFGPRGFISGWTTQTESGTSKKVEEGTWEPLD